MLVNEAVSNESRHNIQKYNPEFYFHISSLNLSLDKIITAFQHKHDGSPEYSCKENVPFSLSDHTLIKSK